MVLLSSGGGAWMSDSWVESECDSRASLRLSLLTSSTPSSAMSSFDLSFHSAIFALESRLEPNQTDVKGKKNREERKRKESEEGGGLEEDIIELLVQFVLRQLHEVFNPVALLQKEVLFERSATDKNNS
jgi:hypothetical protein